MKNKYLILFWGLLIAANSFSQLVLRYETHALQAGDNHYFVLANNDVEEGPAGPHRTWDFSGLQPTGDLTSHMLNVNQVEGAVQAIPEANTIIEEFGNNFCFKVEKNIIKDYGVISCGNTVTHYDEPSVKMVFPFSYQSSYQGNFSGTTGNGKGYTAAIHGTYRLEGDAFGTLILPGGVEVRNVLRHKTIITHTSGDCSYATITYRWYCSSIRYPLLTIIRQEGPNGTKTIRTAYYGNLEEIRQKQQTEEDMLKSTVDVGNLKLYISPNPYKNEFDVKYTLPVDAEVIISLYDINAKEVATITLGRQESGNYSYTIEADKYNVSPGLYYLKLKAGIMAQTVKIIQILKNLN